MTDTVDTTKPLGRWLSNLHDPRRDDHAMSVATHFHETVEERLQRERDWLRGKIIGPPKATRFYSVEELEKMDMVGIYLSGEED